MDLKADIAKLLSAGFSPARVADMLSIKVFIVEALLKDKEFAEQVRKGVTQKVIGGIGRDDKIDTIQDILLTEMKEKLEFGGAADAKLSTLANMFRIVNSAKKVVEPGQQEQGNAGVKIVNVVLPAYMKTFTQVEHQVNQNNEVIAVDGRPMLTMSPNRLQEIAGAATVDVEEAELLERKVVNNTHNIKVKLADLLLPVESGETLAAMDRIPTNKNSNATKLFAEAAAKRLEQLKAGKFTGEDKTGTLEVNSVVGTELELPSATPTNDVSVSVSGDELFAQINAQEWGK